MSRLSVSRCNGANNSEIKIYDIGLFSGDESHRLGLLHEIEEAISRIGVHKSKHRFAGGFVCVRVSGFVDDIVKRLMAAGLNACVDPFSSKSGRSTRPQVDPEQELDEILTFITVGDMVRLEGSSVSKLNISSDEYVSRSIRRGYDITPLFLERDLSGLNGSEAVLSLLPESEDDADVLMDVEMRDISDRLDYAIALTKSMNQTVSDAGLSVHVERWKSVSRDQVRPLGPAMRYNFIRSDFCFYPDGKLESTRDYHVSPDGIRLFTLPGHGKVQRDRTLDEKFSALKGLAFRAPMRWFVWLSGGSYWIKVPTDSEGARAFFADRSSGVACRRKALLHWVQGHYRRSRKSGDSGTATWVNNYLRGNQDFEWHGLRARLIPSLDDGRRIGGDRCNELMREPCVS